MQFTDAGDFTWAWEITKDRSPGEYTVAFYLHSIPGGKYEQPNPRVGLNGGPSSNLAIISLLDREMLLDLHQKVGSLLGQAGVLVTQPASKGLDTQPLP